MRLLFYTTRHSVSSLRRKKNSFKFSLRANHTFYDISARKSFGFFARHPEIIVGCLSSFAVLRNKQQVAPGNFNWVKNGILKSLSLTAHSSQRRNWLRQHLKVAVATKTGDENITQINRNCIKRGKTRVTGLRLIVSLHLIS